MSDQGSIRPHPVTGGLPSTRTGLTSWGCCLLGSNKAGRGGPDKPDPESRWANFGQIAPGFSVQSF